VPAKSKLAWKWSKGASTALTDLGNPTVATDYRLCVYSGSGDLLSLTATAGGMCDDKPCWKATKAGFVYKNKAGSATGITGLTVKSGVEGKAAVSVKAAGINLSVPPLPLSQTPSPVRVQLINSSTNVCWGASYSAPPKSDPALTTKWKDKND